MSPLAHLDPAPAPSPGVQNAGEEVFSQQLLLRGGQAWWGKCISGFTVSRYVIISILTITEPLSAQYHHEIFSFCRGISDIVIKHSFKEGWIFQH